MPIRNGDTVRPASGELRLGTVRGLVDGADLCAVRWQSSETVSGIRVADLLLVPQADDHLIVGDIVRGRIHTPSLGRITRLARHDECYVRWVGSAGEGGDNLSHLVRAIAPEDIERVNREIPWPIPTPPPVAEFPLAIGDRVITTSSRATGVVTVVNSARFYVRWDRFDPQWYSWSEASGGVIVRAAGSPARPAPSQRQRLTARPEIGTQVEAQLGGDGPWVRGRVSRYHTTNVSRVFVEFSDRMAIDYFGTLYAHWWDELWLPAKRKKGEPQFRRTTPKVKKVKPCLHKQGVLVTALGKSVCATCLTNV